MSEFDLNIITISDNICKNISTMPYSERGLVSQNVLSNLINLVEAVEQRIFSDFAIRRAQNSGGSILKK